MDASEGFGGTSDCVVLTFVKKSRSVTFDGVSFFRLLRTNRPFRGPVI